MHLFGQFALPISLRSGITQFSYLALIDICVLQEPVSAQTNSTDATAMNVLKSTLFPSASTALTLYNWTDKTDMCGAASCGPLACKAHKNKALTGPAGGVPSCHWGGICCTEWDVTGLSLLSPIPAASTSQGKWLEVVGWLQNLQVLQLPQQGYSCMPVLLLAVAWYIAEGPGVLRPHDGNAADV